MKIHVLALDATRQGGAGTYTTQLLRTLSQRGHEVTLICHETSEEIKNYAAIHHIARISSKWPYGMWRFANLLQILGYYKALRKLKLSDADLVIASAQPMALPYFFLHPKRHVIYLPHSFVAPVELASYKYTSQIQKWVSVRSYAFFEKKCLEKSKVTIRFSRSAFDSFIRHYGERFESKMVVLPLPVSFPTQDKKKNLTDTLRFLTIGRLTQTKNISFLIHALNKVKDLDWTLDIVGGGAERAHLEDLVNNYRISEKIKFHGHQDKVSEYYSNSDLFLFPSLLENYPIVLIEAMSHSLPALAFSKQKKGIRVANDEIITDGYNGLLADSEEDFEERMREILFKKKDINTLGRNARHTVLERNDWNTHIEKLESFFPPLQSSQCSNKGILEFD